MTHDSGEPLNRGQVEALMRDGVRWRVSYCSGAHTPDEIGAGAPLPSGVLSRVRTAARLRKGTDGSRTYFDARLVTDGLGQLLLLSEP